MEHMEIHTNQELAQAIDDLILQNGIKKTWLSDKMGIANQNFNRLLTKKNLSVDEANKVLKLLGYHAKIIIEKD